MSLFDPPAPLVLKHNGNERVVIACGTFTRPDGTSVAFVRVGLQHATEGGEWRWTPKAGATIPLAMLGKVAAWLVDAARAIPRPESRTSERGWD